LNAEQNYTKDFSEPTNDWR